MDEQAAKRAERDLTSCRALVIDPDPTSRSVLLNQLRDFGVGEVAHCGRVRDARRFLESKKADFVICEQDFHDESDGSGQDLLDDLRRSQLLPYSSVFIMITGGATYAKVSEAAESSLDGYLLKPHKPSVLHERLMLARRRKIYLKPIFDPLDRDDFERAARVCELFFRRKAMFGVFAARMGGELRLRLGHYAEARQLYDEVVADKGLPWARLGIARAWLEEGKTTQALAAVQAVLEGDPSYADAIDVLGRVYVETGQFEKAIEAYSRASELTPGSIARLQRFGILAFYMGDYKGAMRALTRCAILGSDSKMFDYQTFVLLSFCCLYAKDRKLLVRCYDDLGKVVESQPESRRPARFRRLVAMLIQLLNGKQADALEALHAMAAELPSEDFDFEAACNLALGCAELAAQGMDPPQIAGWVRDIGMRYCRSRALTEQLVNTLRRHPPYQEIVKNTNTEVNGLAAKSMAFSLAGDHKTAVLRLMADGQRTLNAKLIENAYMVLQRYPDTPDHAALMAQVVQLREKFGAAHGRDVIGRDTVRRGSATTLKVMAKTSVVDGSEIGPAFAD